MIRILLLLVFCGSFLMAQDVQEVYGEPSIILSDDSDEPDSGNWYEKLRWYKEAKLLYNDDIGGALDDIEELVKNYEDKSKEIFTWLDEYIAALPVKKEEAVQVIDDLLSDLLKRQEELAKEQTRTQVRKVPEESTELEVHQKMLNTLKKQFVDFNTIHKRLKEALDTVVAQQQQAANSFEEKALRAFEEIEGTLDDKKAHEQLAILQNSFDNITALIAYLKGPLEKFITQASSKVKELMPAITKSIEDLEEKGVVVRPLSAEERAEMASLEKKRKELRIKREAERKAEAARKALPWWRKIGYYTGSFFLSMWDGVTQSATWVSDLFVRETPPKKPSPVSKPAPQVQKK